MIYLTAYTLTVENILLATHTYFFCMLVKVHKNIRRLRRGRGKKSGSKELRFNKKQVVFRDEF
jgi:hypothetical protein